MNQHHDETAEAETLISEILAVFARHGVTADDLAYVTDLRRVCADALATAQRRHSS